MSNAKILATGKSVPDSIFTNEDLEKMVETSDSWITSRTGIKERRIADENTATSHLSVQAAEIALNKSGIEPADLDMIIVATVTPDMAFPSTACLVQDKLGADQACAFDLEAACTGFLYGLRIASQFIATDTHKYILVIGSETLSKIVDWEDRNTCVLFGDGAGAAVLGPVENGEEDKGLISFDLGADGSKGELLQQPAGGSLKPATLETVSSKEHFIKMNGNEVFKFAVKVIGDTTEKALKKIDKTTEDIDLFIPHQANQRIIDSATNRLGISKEKTFVNLQNYGNMSAASIPVALDEAIEENLIKEDDLVALVGFGGGLTWGSCLIKW
ncbi:beta-ketoacyl-ACP synthase III [Natranaerobius thermophilus]|uniref:Beta-ketoacyl-[acyl-carrier-protein] synthase III n=1 Tax=Natranaerobius thermophilus (strain ATCC BAA-1301 / DSM 18059 / JW/NM-WN-LF) TaxID=457570 RepID=FABH_NATTJ|nr:beta-ketoacyl-ACP synthase III [Natranaerobius thermophilus]B2A2M5.1 RecName: Full=Beta-ketoacyl-[acyl-carrier-protein] synthase III; Short=Beta-ketoacyl-ACP synthase III; Short=KAS III; AltName: Full=3-oxoacyl-[acyl-carrier-protein] synthase 3; AltName: Full=3-oxoacyl-[acyl-carrier-protein] synthase III [Natranaerobius thermophilus JW/NM-WN-LF]ACB84940.1 3-oxoacyl-(acyl-carrier-protein) synthase III [Natranaerobius thermophilus JW/NM-WN-LF]